MLRFGLITLLALGVGEAFAAPGLAGAPKTIDDLYADVARLAPGFGGLYVDPDQDTLYVYLLEDTPEAVAELEAALTAIFGARAPKQSRLVVLQGQYSFLDLKAWLERLSGVGITGLVFTDIDDARNRLNIGVMTDEVQAQVEEELARLGIPREAVIIEKSAPFEFLSSLQDKHRPLVAGLQITGGSPCTLGFNAIRLGAPGFVTASHCTINPGGEEDTVFYQPFSGLGNLVGQEAVDPRFRVTNAVDSNCPAGNLCRCSDSAFVGRRGGIITFSTIDKIQRADFELGPLTVCPPGFAC